jgi:hypothetical protein
MRVVLVVITSATKKIAIAAVVRYWAKALIYFGLFAYPGLKSGAIV